jgi:23S rRNA pseudouridine1911/1915/1917 synthase
VPIDHEYRRPLQAPDTSAEGPDEGDPPSDDIECRRATVSEPMHGRRLDQALVEWAGEFSRSHLQRLIEGGHVRVDAQVVKTASRRLQLGQVVEFDLVPTPESRAFRAEPMPLSIVHEDAALIVVDKPAGLVVHPAAGNWSGTLLNGLLAHHAAAATLPRAGIVHRLDKGTSGLMVVAKTLEAATALARAIAAREVHRQYRALCWGRVAAQPFSVDAPIGRDPVSRVRMAVLASGRPARTDVRVVAVNAGLGISAVECTLHTGRTHQIRVHMAHRGHPLVADEIYGGRPALDMSRQALHAARLSFVHPTTQQVVDFASALPADLRQAWQAVVA